MSYTLKKNVLGKYHIAYACPKCKAVLDSPIEEAGELFPCPTSDHRLTVPGLSDKQRLESLQQAKAQHEAQERAKREQEMKQREEMRKVAEVKHRAEAALKANQEALLREQGVRSLSRADRFLLLAFKIAKGISVFVVAACLLVIVFCLIRLLLVSPAEPTTAVPSMRTPTVAEYQRFIRPDAPPSQAASPSANSAPAATAVKSNYDLLEELLLRHAGGRAQSFFPSSYPDERYLAAIEEFLKSLQAQKLPVELSAVKWFDTQYKAAAEAVEEAESRRQDEENRAELEARFHRNQLAMFIAGTVGILLSFLFLPLLIQVEQNTRWLYQYIAMPKE